jgi:prevent-host-death family protein
MTELTASELARKLSAVLDRLEFGGEEIVILRNNHPIARIIPGAPYRTALEAMADLHRTISPAAAESWLKDSRIPGDIGEQVRDPWDS